MNVQIEHIKENLKSTLEQCKHVKSFDMITIVLFRLSDDLLHLAEWVDEKIRFCEKFFEAEQQKTLEEIIEQKQPEEPLITIREFCNSLIINGNMIILPHNLLGYITKDRVHFEGCFFQIKKGSPVKVYRKKLMEKLPKYPKASKILKQFLEEHQKNGQRDQEDREGCQEDREGSEASRKAG